MLFNSRHRKKEKSENDAETCVGENTADELQTEETPQNKYDDPVKLLLKSKTVRFLGIATIISLIIMLISLFSPAFSEYYSRTVGGAVRAVLAKITGIFPFSVAETLIFSFIVFILYAIIRGIYEAVKKVDYSERFDAFANRTVVCGLLLAYSLYNFGFVTCNRRYPLDKNLGLERNPLTSQQLYDCMMLVNEEIDKCIDEGDIRRTPNGAACMPYSYDELNEVLNGVYEEACDKYDFINDFSSRAKRLAISPLMTYTHISGVYIPYTGEVNINTNYPDYVIAFSEAHEMAHQRGIAREDEANFVAFLVMYESDDNYLRYCALTELYDYVADALYVADEELFYTALIQSNRQLLGEIIAFEDFFTPYSSSAASTVMNTVNDVSIKLRGDSNGANSYDMMIELAAAYFGI